ncbi:hypothetical protein MADP15_00471 [Mycoplasma anatis]|uniref:hypothetical protein n=2 Tax=Mycoplasmopsis anatis TaxID=171279 RepID=UPI001C4ED779|nr:hypothetical protein [Mycoplasmopsis anatis]MBW0596168.1 hypothetical protein [Mycoplasmopsis anatis]MBW0596846.1 hypothetical protein [Mycoplasmopsis anatis]MBW0600545.1 hypothetical protein [Mycoplasmopsis anatis]
MSMTNKKALKIITGLLLGGAVVTVGSCVVAQQMIEKESLRRAYTKNFEINEVRRNGLRNLINKLDDTDEHRNKRNSLLAKYDYILSVTTDPKKLKENNTELENIFNELSKEINPLYNTEKEKLEKVYNSSLIANSLYDELCQILVIKEINNSKDLLNNIDNAITIQNIKDEIARIQKDINDLQESAELRTKIKNLISFQSPESLKAKNIIDAAKNSNNPTYKDQPATAETVTKILNISNQIESKHSMLEAFAKVGKFTVAQKESLNQTFTELTALYSSLENL